MKLKIDKYRGETAGVHTWFGFSHADKYIIASLHEQDLVSGTTYEIPVLEQSEEDRRYDRFWIDGKKEIVAFGIEVEETKEGKVPKRKVTKKPVKKAIKKKAKKSTKVEDVKSDVIVEDNPISNEDAEEMMRLQKASLKETITDEGVSDADVKAMEEINGINEETEKGISLVIAPESQLDLNTENVKKYLSPLATDQEIYMFMQLCINQNLNPFIKDAYLIKYDRSQPASMVVSKDAFLKKAEQIGDYEGFHAGIVVQRTDVDIDQVIIERREGSMKLEGETLIGGWAKIYRKDMKVFTAEVSFKEYNTNKSSWRKIPSTMIRKVAIVQALREAFPMSFQGMYDMSEIDVEKK